MDQEIDLRRIVYVLKKNIRFILIFTCLIITITAAISFFLLKPIYEVRANLLVNKTTSTENVIESSSVENIETNLRLIETYLFIIQSERVTDVIIEKLEGKYSQKDLLKKIEVKTIENSQIISVLVTDPDPSVAAKIANMVAEVFQTEIKYLMNMNNVQILTKAKVDEKSIPITPKPILNLILAFLIGVTLSGAAVLIKEYFYVKLDTKENVEKFLTLPVLAVISSIQNDKKRNRKQKNYNERHFKLITEQEAHSPITEAYRTLRTNIQFLNMEKPLKTILFTSTNQGDGKTVTSGNLAVIMAMGNKKTAYVDADLRKPHGQLLFNRARNDGLSTYLSNHSQLEDILTKTDHENFEIIGAGPVPPNPAELLSSVRMEQLLKELSERFDVVIIDTPPLIVSDAAVLATKVDGCILVVNAEKTRRDQAVESIEHLRNVNASIVGAVLNKKKMKKRDIYYY